MEPDKTYRVLRLIAENYKRLRAADITPPRNAVVVSGKNRAGKTSLLDSIAAVLGGKKNIQAVPLTKGAESGQVLCVLGESEPELLVKRTFDASGKTLLEITSADGYKAPTPQAILDKLCSMIAFDPLAFVNMEPKAQMETLKALVGLDFSEWDKQRLELYNERTGLNRGLKSLDAQVKAIVVPEGTPEKPVDVGELMGELRRRQEHNRTNQVERDKVPLLKATLQTEYTQANRLAQLVTDLEQRLAKAKSELETQGFRVQTAEENLKSQEATIAVLEDADLEAVQKQVVDVQVVNANVAKAQRKAALESQSKEAKAKADAATEAIESIDRQKSEALASAKWPVPGLSFGTDGVLYNGLPFEQASGAEALTVSFAICAAMSPQVRVALVRDASLLDDEQFQVVCKLAEQYDMQCWLEKVQDGSQCGIVIEDGEIVAGGTPSDVPPAKPKRTRRTKTEQPRPFGPEDEPSPAADDYNERHGNGEPQPPPAEADGDSPQEDGEQAPF